MQDGTHGDGLADVGLNLVGDVFLDEELDGEAIAVLKDRLRALTVSMHGRQGGKDGRTMAAALAEASNLGRGLEFPLSLIRLGSWLPARLPHVIHATPHASCSVERNCSIGDGYVHARCEGCVTGHATSPKPP